MYVNIAWDNLQALYTVWIHINKSIYLNHVYYLLN